METFTFAEEENNRLHEILCNSDCIEITELKSNLEEFFSNSSKETINLMINGKNIYGNTPLMEYVSCMEPRSEIVSFLLAQCSCDVNIKNKLGMTPLHKVVLLHFLPERIVEGKFLGELEKTIVDQQFLNEKQIISQLIDAGANVNTADAFGRSPLFFANDMFLIKTLIRAGADLNVTDKCGRSVLSSALSMPNNEYLVDFYLSVMNKEQISKPDIFGSTAIDYAKVLHLESIVEKLENLANTQKTDRPSGSLETSLAMKTILYDRESFSTYRKFDLKKIECVHYTDIMKKKDLSFALHQPKSCKDLYAIFNLPGLGVPKVKNESDDIKKCVTDLVSCLCKNMSMLDPRMKCTLFPAGSSAEGTKLGDPTEFDFVFCLEEFSNICDIKEITSKKGFAELKGSAIPDTYKSFFDDNGKCSATEIRLVFSKLLKRIVLDENTWKMTNLFFDGDVHHLEEYDRPVFTLKLQYFGLNYKDLNISLDIVPAVRKYGWWPSDTDLKQFEKIPQNVKAEGCLLLLQNPYLDLDTLFRISSSPAEICLMKSFPAYVRESYRLCKLLRHKSMCPRLDPDATWDTFPEFEADDAITSYMLKNCLFRVCAKIEITPDETKVDENELIVNTATLILKEFERCTTIESLPVYFLPNREDIFRFNFKEIDDLDDKTVNEYNHFHCCRRKAFVKIMLFVLRQDVSGEAMLLKYRRHYKEQ